MIHLTLEEMTKEDIIENWQWRVKDNNYSRYTCRPLPPAPSLRKYMRSWVKRIKQSPDQWRSLKDGKTGDLLGRFAFFDHNTRNKSGEFGYYIPAEHRKKGYGIRGAELFISYCFKQFELNKLMASTSDNNHGSKRILESLGFRIDGRNREHYWIGNEKYDQLIYSLLKSEKQE